MPATQLPGDHMVIDEELCEVAHCDRLLGVGVRLGGLQRV